jgi:hypothetical protein
MTIAPPLPVSLTPTLLSGYHNRNTSLAYRAHCVWWVGKRTGAMRDTPASRSPRKPWDDVTRRALARIPSLAFRSTVAHALWRATPSRNVSPALTGQ